VPNILIHPEETMNTTQENSDNVFIPIKLIEMTTDSHLAKYVEEWMSGHRAISKTNLLFLASCSDRTDLDQIQKRKSH
jgi:hypothetical protein